MDDPLDAGGRAMKDWGWDIHQGEDEKTLLGVICRLSALLETMKRENEREIAELIHERSLRDPPD